jgi:hypothetical protein
MLVAASILDPVKCNAWILMKAFSCEYGLGAATEYT